MCIERLKRLWGNWFGGGVFLIPTFKEAHNKEEPERKDKGFWGRLISTWGGGPNMPRLQTCPECRTWCKRVKKTDAGAWYHCRRCKQEFFVPRAPGHPWKTPRRRRGLPQVV